MLKIIRDPKELLFMWALPVIVCGMEIETEIVKICITYLKIILIKLLSFAIKSLF